MRCMASTLRQSSEAASLTLRLSFVLGNLTERSDRLRMVFAFDCEGTALVPELLGKYWQKERQEKGEAEEVLVKLVRRKERLLRLFAVAGWWPTWPSRHPPGLPWRPAAPWWSPCWICWAPSASRNPRSWPLGHWQGLSPHVSELDRCQNGSTMGL